MLLFKKILVCLFIAGISFPSELAHLITFVPEFIEHYEHHNAEHHKVSFVDFIYEHIGSHEEHEEQHEKKSCPIHHNHETVTQSLYVPRTTDFEIFISSDQQFNSDKREFPSVKFNTSEIHFEIWQPPKIG
ncbi:MAG: hypothetical protein K9G36_09640 [Crocinitomicaceae bacterium]|nr:hypothetical protein [Crocinitomicaceae bacterium]MCF8409886.1 hypothetical protein [Crocinitomicaceae bacterium]MCF8435087.1 hypothetical protein [Crocinitomicaceae bacterium]